MAEPSITLMNQQLNMLQVQLNEAQGHLYAQQRRTMGQAVALLELVDWAWCMSITENRLHAMRSDGVDAKLINLESTAFQMFKVLGETTDALRKLAQAAQASTSSIHIVGGS